MNPARIGTIVRLELTQRTRSVAWYVLLGVFAVLLIGVTWLSFAAFGGGFGGGLTDQGSWIYSTIVCFTLLLIVLVSPTLSGNAINGDRDAATLAPVQVTLATTGEILLAKFLAAWVTGLAFVVVAVPFLAFATLAGGVSPAAGAVSLGVLVIETGVIAAIGVALSGILARPLFSVASTYLIVAALVVGTLIAFGLLGASIRSEGTTASRSFDWDKYQDSDRPCFPGEVGGCDPDIEPECGPWNVQQTDVPRFDRVWWLLAANPFVVLADATPVEFGPEGYPVDLFGQIKAGVRMAQQPPQLDQRWDDCSFTPPQPSPTAEEIVRDSSPSWFVGLALQLALAAALLWWAWARTRTPAKRLPPGTRIA